MSAFMALPRRALRRRGVRIALIVAAVVTGLTVAAEVAARAVVHGRISEAAGRSLDGEVEVKTGDGLALGSLAGRHLDWIEMRGDHARIGRVTDASVRVRLNDVRLDGLGSGSGGTVAATHAEVLVPTESLPALAGRADSGGGGGGGGGGLTVGAARADPASGTVVLDIGGGLGQVAVKPALREGRVAFEVTEASFLGMAVPGDLVERVAETLSDPTEHEEYPLALEATSVEVTEDGVEVLLDGGPAALETDGG
ncbi:LmeA family phospholipid-binding protein [Streptomyces sp. NBC_01803]|uniref:LmeA family phospholipid-binding protein n=1 Tax=Streptomyces sp. NBC_01803 TaxID=2975946 RepID=UPI002DD99B3F|nr:LmeA family phospholipid-binding protein [Streptomyces sp. NBC_01803]WSA45196.1 LmeA family phospholipid-binding protein [Streptomyces sp. NBC_01803]